jgi:hypothetical protein
MASGTALDKEIDHRIESPSDNNSMKPEIADMKPSPDSADGDTDVEAGLPGELEWNSPENAANPRNWPVVKKILHTAVPALYGFVL